VGNSTRRRVGRPDFHRLGARMLCGDRTIEVVYVVLDRLAWARFNRQALAEHELFATGTTGSVIASALELPVHQFLSGPLGDDQHVGAAIAEGRIDAVVFFWDPLEPHPHDVDVKARFARPGRAHVAIACNGATGDFVLSNPPTNQEYRPSFTPQEGIEGTRTSRHPG